MIVAHRGNAAEFRENSLEAIRSAFELGVQYVEVDVQLSSDGVPVLSHDPNLNRLFGVGSYVGDLTAVTLTQIGVATLQSAVDMATGYGGTLFVEIKLESIDRFGDYAITRTLERVGNHVAISFSRRAVDIARTKGYRAGWVVPDLSEKTRRDSSHIEFLFVHQRKVSRDKKLWPARWVAYEVDTPKMMKELSRCGIGMFETMNVRSLCSQL